MIKEIIINETLGVSKESILNKEHNLWVGFSFGNKWFTKENLERLINFELKYTNRSLLILIPSRLYATNLRYVDKLSRAESLKRAFEAGDKQFLEVQNIKAGLGAEAQKKVIVAKYDDVLTSQCIAQRGILLREFSKQQEFYNLVMEIAFEMLELRSRTTSKDRAESVALFVLQELSFFIDGVMKIGTSIVHTVVLYPGLGKIDELVMKIRNGDNLRLLREKLNIKNFIGIASIE